MVSAILAGLEEKMDLSSIYIYSPSGNSAKLLAEKFGLVWVENIVETKFKVFDYVLLGCKPQQLSELSLKLPDELRSKTFISMLAALSEKEQINILKTDKLIRIMPNLPVAYGAGVTLISSKSAGSDLAFILRVFSLLGYAQILEEHELDELTILTGSGPALFYEFSKNLSNSFNSLDSEKREYLTRLVFLGAAINTSKNSDSLRDLIDSVTSKGGVTIEVLKAWRSSRFDELILKGISAGKIRSDEIMQQFSKT